MMEVTNRTKVCLVRSFIFISMQTLLPQTTMKLVTTTKDLRLRVTMAMMRMMMARRTLGRTATSQTLRSRLHASRKPLVF